MADKDENIVRVDLENTQSQNVDPLMGKIHALLYLIAGLVVIFAPIWLLYSAMNGKEVPMINQIMYFCAIGIATIMGMTPWVLRMLFDKGNGK